VENVTYRYVGRAEYGAVWEMQKRMFNELLEAKKAGIGAGQTLLMVEHPHVYTLGKSGHESNMLVSDEFLRSIGASYFHTDRGGDITYHGYGQLVGYPILDLERLGLSLKEYVWTVEECVMRTVAEYGIEATLVNPRFATELDREFLDSLAAEHRVVVTIEDGILDGGWGERVACYLACTPLRTRTFGIAKGFPDRYDPNELLAQNGFYRELYASQFGV